MVPSHKLFVCRGQLQCARAHERYVAARDLGFDESAIAAAEVRAWWFAETWFRRFYESEPEPWA